MTIPYPAPCAPVIQDHSLDCVSNHALVSWVEDKDAKNVTVKATSKLGHSASCSSTTNSSCVLDDLQCGNTYTVQAVARGVQCLSKPSSTFQIVTGTLKWSVLSDVRWLLVKDRKFCKNNFIFLFWSNFFIGVQMTHIFVHRGCSELNLTCNCC